MAIFSEADFVFLCQLFVRPNEALIYFFVDFLPDLWKSVLVRVALQKFQVVSKT